MRLDVIMAKARGYRQAGDKNLWALAWLASKAVDKATYGEGAVIDFSQAIKRTGRTVYNLAKAWATYSGLRQDFAANFKMWPQVKRYSDLRFNLPYAHFLAMGELLRRFEFSPVEAIGYLVDAMELEMSADAMADKVEVEQDGNHREPNKEEVFSKSTGKAVYELEQAGLNAPSDEVASIVNQAAEAIRRFSEPSPKDEPSWYPAARFVRAGAIELSRQDDVPTGLSDALTVMAEAIEQVMNQGE